MTARTRLALIVAIALALLAPVAPADAVTRHAPAPALLSREVVDDIVREVYVVPCVTTTWRARYWQLEKTRVGAVCFATPDMWIPKAWPVVGHARAGGRSVPVYLRTL